MRKIRRTLGAGLLLATLLLFSVGPWGLAGVIPAWAGPFDDPPTLLQTNDVGATAIISPPDQIILNVTYPLKSEVTNFGTAANTFDVVFQVYIFGTSTLIVSDTITIVLMPGGEIDTVTFGPTFTPTLDTTYQFVSYTALAGDENPANNTSAITTTFWNEFAVWYGNVNGSPVQGNINARFNVNTYVWGGPDVYVADIHLCLGTNDLYIDSLLSLTEGQYFYPFTFWDAKLFLDPAGSPPNPIGWHSQSFIGFARLSPGSQAPWLHFEVPTQVLRYVVKARNDSTMIGKTARAIGPGLNAQQGPSNAGDTLGLGGYDVLEHFSPFYFQGAGTVQGTVRDQSSVPIPGVMVTDLNTGKVTLTAANGTYALSNLFPGLHDISFHHPNYQDTVVTGVSVPPNGTRTLNMILAPLPFDDVGVSDIISPPQFVQLNVNYPLRSEIRNYGTATSSFDVVFEAYVLDAPLPLVADTFEVTNMPGTSVDTITFDSTLFTSLDTIYYLVSYTLLPGDADPENDTSTSTSTIFFGVSAWYGNLDSAPLIGYIDERLAVDVYIQTVESIYLSYMHLCLGADNEFIDSLLGQDEGEVYYPFTEWDVALFSSPFASPPNPPGWSSQSFWGVSSIGSIINPWLHFEIPTKALMFMTKTVNNPLLAGDTATCFGPGLNPFLGPSSASDTLVSQNYPVIEVFSPVFFKTFGWISGTVTDQGGYPIDGAYVQALGIPVDDTSDLAGGYFLDTLLVGTYDVLFSHPVYRDTTVQGVEVFSRQVTILDVMMRFPCDYVPGDVNGDGVVLGSDITYGVRYFAQTGPPPPDSCFNEVENEWLYSAGDANGDCVFLTSDLLYLVNYLKGLVPNVLFCPQTPPPAPGLATIYPNKAPLNIPRVRTSMEDVR